MNMPTEGIAMEDIGMKKDLLKVLISEVKSQSVLLWNCRRLRCLPSELICCAQHVVKIYLKNNSISYLPKNLGSLSNLTTLYLYGNELEELTDCIGDLVSLSVLDVSKNRLRTLPAAIGKLTKLKSLSACHNQIIRLPDEICSLSALSVLMLTDNDLKHLPNGIHKLVALQGLFLDHNYLQYLPTAISCLPILTHLSCCHNDIRYLPCQPFITKTLTMYFDFNSALNFIPYCILDEIKTRAGFDPFVIPAYGCFEASPFINGKLKVCLSHRSSSVVCLPPQLRSVSRYGQEITMRSPPLLEICFRRVWNILKDSVLLRIHTLPTSLKQILVHGPISYCEYCKCTNIFTYASIIVITINVTSEAETVGKNVPTILFFCGDLCAKLFIKKCTYSYPTEYYSWLKSNLHNPCPIDVV